MTSRSQYLNDPLLNCGIALMYCINHGRESQWHFAKSLGKFFEAQNILSGATWGVNYDSADFYTQYMGGFVAPGRVSEFHISIRTRGISPKYQRHLGSPHSREVDKGIR